MLLILLIGIVMAITTRGGTLIAVKSGASLNFTDAPTFTPSLVPSSEPSMKPSAIPS